MNWTEFKTKYNPCDEAVTYIDALGIEDCTEIIQLLCANNKSEWALWVLAQLIPQDQQVAWKLFCAEIVLPHFEKNYPNDDRPRKAIEVARRIAHYSNAADAARAIYEAYLAADAAADASNAAFAAAYEVSSSSASNTAYSAAYAAKAAYAACSAKSAYEAASAAYDATDNSSDIKAIVNEGLRLLDETRR